MILTRFEDINASFQDQTLQVGGFVHSIRDHGGLLFIDLRSMNDLLQCVIEPTSQPQVFDTAQSIKDEFVLKITGVIRLRSESTRNPNLPTGMVELVVTELEIISTAKILPFNIHATVDKDMASEELRLKYRYLDLRREKLKTQLMQYHKLNLAARNWFAGEGFTEVATPILANSSPEGARDYLVPSRIHTGKFYALPQAPQQFKQLLMVGGFTKYFQIAPCFRDEDPRADRHPGDFYQYDCEIAWASEEDIIELCQKLVLEVFAKFTSKTVKTEEFIRITYSEAMEKYGSDKPDLRYELAWMDVKSFFGEADFAAFKSLSLDPNARVQALVVPGAVTEFSRSDLDKLQDIGRSLGLPGIAYIQYTEAGAKSPIFKFFGDTQEAQDTKAEELRSYLSAETGDLVLFVANSDRHLVYKAEHAMRKHIGTKLNLINDNELQFVWIEGFPFFEKDAKTGKIDFGHNPFSVWHGGSEALEAAKVAGTEALLGLNARQYDIAVNGYEVLSGGVRNQNMDSLIQAFEIVGYTRDEVMSKFGHMIEAYSYGAPTHAGFAWGLDRLVMVLQGEESIREIIAFPKNGSAVDAMMNSPNTVRDSQLKELHIKILE